MPTLIFDCDGVLIDSEILVCELVAGELTAHGYPITTSEVITRFAGRPEPEMLAEIERDRGGRPLPERFISCMHRRITQAYATELRPMAGVADILCRVRAPACVASSSAPAKLRLGLETTGLLPYFGGNVVSASSVVRGKPAPDVFLYAAGWMRADIRDCVVIEDSVPGVTAARAAGLRTFGFVGGGHCASDIGARLLAAGAERILASMSDLPPLLPQAFADPIAA
ncbi:HAD family hydrolase [Methylobacterium sp. CM6247]